VANGSWSWGNIGYVATGTAGDFDPTNASDAIVDLVYALGARYRANASFVMNSKTAGAVRKMKDADGRFLWSDGLSQGQPARLMGYPVLIAEDMPDIATDAMAIAFGDFGAGYTIAERPDLRVLRDPFSAKPHVLFYATKRVGGDVTDFAAIKLMKFGMSCQAPGAASGRVFFFEFQRSRPVSPFCACRAVLLRDCATIGGAPTCW
jgi:HK97 family phage major capsid protein